MPNGNGLQQHAFTLESHEDRLQDVEKSLKAVEVTLGKLETAQGYVVEQVESNTKLILDKLEHIDGKFASVETRLTPLETFDKSQKATRKNVKSFLKAVALAAACAFAGGLGTYLWSLVNSGL